MIGEIQYGGRVTDDFDKRLLLTMTKRWFTETMLTENYEVHPRYPLLQFKTTAEYLDALSNFPNPDSPVVFGLHPNANIS